MELFRLNRFDLFARALPHSVRIIRENVTMLKEKLKGLEGVSEKAAAETETEMSTVNEVLAKLEHEIKKNTVQLQQWEELAALYKELEAAEARTCRR